MAARRRDPRYVLQSVIVLKSHPGVRTCAGARRVAARYGAFKRACDETDQSFRFRQLDPELFIRKTFRTKAIGTHVRLVYGKVRDVAVAEEAKSKASMARRKSRRSRRASSRRSRRAMSRR